MKETIQSFVLGFSGRIASGKSAVSATVAKELQFQRASFGGFIRDVAGFMGLNVSDRQILQDIGNLLAEHPREFCAKVLEHANYKRGQNLVIDGIRHKRIADELRVQIAPAELILIYVEADSKTIEDRLREKGYTDLDIERLEHDPTEAEVLTVLPGLADFKVKTDNDGPVENVAGKVLEWLQHYSAIKRAASSDEKVVVSKFEYDHLKDGVQQLMLAWLNESDTKEQLQRCADFAIGVLHSDLTLRVPRSPDQRKDGFATWRNVWQDRLSPAIQEEFHRQFPGVADRLSPEIINVTVVDFLWPRIEPELLAFAIEGLARTWVRRRMGDATILRQPRSDGANWVVPLGIQGHDTDLGQVVLDRDGNIIEESSSTRDDILVQLHG